MTADDVIAAARAVLDTPFRHQGRLAGRGLDCAGLGVHVARALGLEYIDDITYGRHPANGLFEAALDRQPCLVRIGDPELRQAGDYLLMRFNREPQHLSIVTDRGIIHSYREVGKVCEHRLDALWIGRIVRCYRFRGLA